MKIYFKKNRNKSIGALGLIRKCLTVSPSSRFTVDDIAVYWWVNVGYKYPPIYYYDTSIMKKHGTMMSSHPPSVRFNETTKTKTGSTGSEQKPKTITRPVSTNNRPVPPPPPPPLAVRVPPPSLIQNGRLTDIESKSKAMTNGYHQIIQSHQLNDNTKATINNNKNGTVKSNQLNRLTSNNKPNDGILLPSKQPLPRTVVH